MPRRALLALGLAIAAFMAAPAVVMPAQAAQSNPESFDQTDLDHDGRIDREEYRRRMVEVFYFADTDKNGYVTIAELEVIETFDAKAFKKADRDGDGKLDLDEFVTYRMIQFDEADTNRDGVLTREEVEVWQKR